MISFLDVLYFVCLVLHLAQILPFRDSANSLSSAAHTYPWIFVFKSSNFSANLICRSGYCIFLICMGVLIIFFLLFLVSVVHFSPFNFEESFLTCILARSASLDISVVYLFVNLNHFILCLFIIAI